MLFRPCSPSLLAVTLCATACFSEPPTVSDEEASTGVDEDGTSADDLGDETGGAASGGSADDGSDGSGSDDGYGPEVTDALDLPFPPFNYADPNLPPHFAVQAVQAQDNTPPDNPVTDDGATLGRVLFHDTALSANDTIACASCHIQSLGFTDDAQFSVGFEGGETGRNSMSIANAGYYASGRFFWDERAATLEEQVLMPIQDEVEMGLTLDELVDNVSAQPYYPELFERAFGDPDVTSDRIARALAQYVRAIVSYRSRYDEGLVAAGSVADDFPNFTAEENLGKALFMGPQGNCGICHLATLGPPPPPGTPPANQAVFMLTEPANNGLDAETSADEGAGAGAFKSPSLRNVALSGPYMHDGRFESLEEVVEHYVSGVQDHPDLDPRLRQGAGQPPQQLGLSAGDSAALVAFLHTLTDEAVLEDPKYADPFRN